VDSGQLYHVLTLSESPIAQPQHFCSGEVKLVAPEPVFPRSPDLDSLSLNSWDIVTLGITGILAIAPSERQ
jgi:hypothetical protein